MFYKLHRPTLYLNDEYGFEQLNINISLKELSKHMEYKILCIPLTLQKFYTRIGGNSPKSFIKEEQTIQALAVLCNLSNGLLSYLPIMPYYRINKKVICDYPTVCNDIIIRFSIRRDGRGFFIPKWISCINKDKLYTPFQSGRNRIDYFRFDDDCLSYKGFSVFDTLKNETNKHESLRLAFLEWVLDHSERSSKNMYYKELCSVV